MVRAAVARWRAGSDFGLVQTGLDLLEFPAILFYESGYSTNTLRQASRRSWRIGQHRNVTVKFLQYAGAMQETCLRLMANTANITSHGVESHQAHESPGTTVKCPMDIDSHLEF